MVSVVAITGDPKATMQYEEYEKLIVVDRGVEIINWPDDIPFVNASDIGSLHTLSRLLMALRQDREKQCRWVTLSAEEWEKRKDAYLETQALIEPRKRKQGAPREPAETQSESEHLLDGEVEESRPKKKGRKGKENKGNSASAALSKSKKGKETGRSKAKKSKAKALAPSDSNRVSVTE